MFDNNFISLNRLKFSFDLVFRSPNRNEQQLKSCAYATTCSDDGRGPERKKKPECLAFVQNVGFSPFDGVCDIQRARSLVQYSGDRQAKNCLLTKKNQVRKRTLNVSKRKTKMDRRVFSRLFSFMSPANRSVLFIHINLRLCLSILAIFAWIRNFSLLH